MGAWVKYTGEDKRGPLGVVIASQRGKRKVFFFRTGTSSWIKTKELKKHNEKRRSRKNKKPSSKWWDELYTLVGRLILLSYSCGSITLPRNGELVWDISRWRSKDRCWRDTGNSLWIVIILDKPRWCNSESLPMIYSTELRNSETNWKNMAVFTWDT